MKKVSHTKLNIIASLLLQVVSGVVGLILPRYILAAFGSEANGLIASVSQLLGYTVLLEGGIGGVMKAALYKPLAKEDMDGISGIYHQIRRIYRRISYFFIIFAIILAVVMKFLVDTRFDWLYVFTMVLILGFSNYFSYYFALPQRMLMTADQKLYIIQFTQTITIVLNFFICLLVLHFGGGIHTVKLTSSFVFLLKPFVLYEYVKRNYRIKKTAEVEEVSIPQKRDAVIHHLSYFLHRNTDIVILSLFNSLANISVYTVYHTVINILEQLLVSISSGLSGAIGNLLAREETKRLNQLVDRYEAWSNALATSFATVCAILILPFVSIYTGGVTDAQYHQPLFAYLAIAGSYAYSIRHPFGSIVSAAGHYRETKAGAIGEVVINLGISLLLVKPLGLVGVALGTVAAMTFRTFHTVWYLSKHILHRPVCKFLLKLICNLGLSVFLIYWISHAFDLTASTIPELFICAVKVSAVVFPLFVILNVLISYKSMLAGKKLFSKK